MQLFKFLFQLCTVIIMSILLYYIVILYSFKGGHLKISHAEGQPSHNM